MLDVNPPHEAAHSWKDFFIHIATIVIGLLIAVGLEQTVEVIHHHNQVVQTRRELEHERESNRQRFQMLYEALGHVAHTLAQNTEVYAWLRQHPHAPPAQWPRQLEIIAFPNVPYNDAAWKTAQLSGVLDHMPLHEVNQYNQLYALLAAVNLRQEELRNPIIHLRGVRIDGPPEDLTPQQFDEAARELKEVRIQAANLVTMQHVIAVRFKDFPDDVPFFDLRGLLLNEVQKPDTMEYWDQAVQRLNAIDAKDDKE